MGFVIAAALLLGLWLKFRSDDKRHKNRMKEIDAAHNGRMVELDSKRAQEKATWDRRIRVAADRFTAEDAEIDAAAVALEARKRALLEKVDAEIARGAH